eukprot:914375_1
MMPTPSANTKEESCSSSSSSKPPAVKVSLDSSEAQSPDPESKDQSGSGSSAAEISQRDVLFGRGGGTTNHAGNIYFRTLVSQHQPVYVKARRFDKAVIAKSIVAEIRSQNGRFLRKEENISGERRWVDVGDKKACAKTGQALREGLGGKMKDIVGKAGAGILQLKKIGFLEKNHVRLNEREIQMRLDDLDGMYDDDDDDDDDEDTEEEEEDVSTENTGGKKR